MTAFLTSLYEQIDRTCLFYALQLLCAGLLFAGAAERRAAFIVRVLTSAAALLVLSPFFPCFQPSRYLPATDVLLCFAVFLGCLPFWYKLDIRRFLLFATAAASLQHIGTLAAFLLRSVPFIAERVWLFFLTDTAAFAAVYAAGRLLFAKRAAEEIHARADTVVFICLYLFVVTYMLQFLVQPDDLRVFAFYNIVCTALGLIVLFQSLTLGNLRYERAVGDRLYAEREKQYKYLQANIDEINRKTHDLKHMARLLGSMTETDRAAAAAELEANAAAYEGFAKTGSAVLDNVLTEVGIYCRANGIAFTYIADGAAISFMRPMDIVVLFKNALDNAVEAQMRLQGDERQNRSISLNLAARGCVVCLSIENYYSGGLVLEGGIPRTAKADKSAHGFGVRSIRTIAEKYGGRMQLSARNRLFRLQIVFPRKEEEN